MLPALSLRENRMPKQQQETCRYIYIDMISGTLFCRNIESDLVLGGSPQLGSGWELWLQTIYINGIMMDNTNHDMYRIKMR